jgi:hypothetical protein
LLRLKIERISWRQFKIDLGRAKMPGFKTPHHNPLQRRGNYFVTAANCYCLLPTYLPVHPTPVLSPGVSYRICQ